MSSLPESSVDTVSVVVVIMVGLLVDKEVAVVVGLVAIVVVVEVGVVVVVVRFVVIVVSLVVDAGLVVVDAGLVVVVAGVVVKAVSLVVNVKLVDGAVDDDINCCPLWSYSLQSCRLSFGDTPSGLKSSVFGAIFSPCSFLL